MLNAKQSQIKLEKYHSDCVNYWKKQKNIDEKEAYKRALEYDLIEIYKMNQGCIHDPYSMAGEELDKEATLDFFKYKCMDLYEKEWESHWDEYNL